MKTSVSFFQFLSLFLCLVLCLITIQGVYKIGTYQLVIFGLWLLVTFYTYSKILSKIFKQRRFIFFLLFVLFRFMCLIFNNPVVTSINNTVEFLCVFSPILMYEIIKQESRGIRGIFIYSLLMVLLLNVVLSYSYLELTSAISMRGANELGEEFYIVEVAFNTCYALVVLAPALIDIVKKRRQVKDVSRLFDILLVSLSIIFLVFIIRAQFMTAVILAFGGIFISLFYKKKYLLRFVLFGVILFFAGKELLPSLINTLDSNGDYRYITERLVEVNQTLSGQEEQADDLNNRKGRSAMSLETFINNPLFGVSYKLDSKVHVQNQGVGNHAAWFDSLALYGIFALLLIYFIYNSLLRQRKEEGSGLTMFLFIALGFLNPLLYFPQMSSVFLLVPLMYQYFVREKKSLA